MRARNPASLRQAGRPASRCSASLRGADCLMEQMAETASIRQASSNTSRASWQSLNGFRNAKRSGHLRLRSQLSAFVAVPIFLAISGCTSLDNLYTAMILPAIYKTDPNANVFFRDMDCCRGAPEDSNSVHTAIPSLFPIGSSSQMLLSYIEEWGGSCAILEHANECEITASMYSPTRISLSTVNRIQYNIEWRGDEQISSYTRISSNPIFFGHINADQWDREVGLQQGMISRNTERDDD